MAAQRSYGVAVVGAGNIAAAHVDAVSRLPNAHLVGVASRTHDSARAFADEHGTEAYPDLDTLLADDAVDVVAVCTPSGAHMEPAVAAARAGKHVVVEKPLEVTSERARAIIDAADEAGVRLATIFMSRFADANVALKQAVDAGTLGRVIQADAYVKWFRSQAYYDSADWRGTWRLDGGGALMNQAIHQVDLLLWLMGPVEEVFAYAATKAHERLEVEDTLVAVLRYRNGALGHISAATSLWPGRAKELDVHGELGVATVRDDALVRWELQGASDEASAEMLSRFGSSETGGAADPMAISFENHRRQYADVLAAIDEGRAPSVDGHEGLRSVELIEAIYRSVREGRPVRPGGEAA
ncbi:MAG: Gfo/Idh/MocA family oxidoreductase [Trueperaceae bacterium]|nr:Gfo/Idh/MocA family oxidoreductase [Trueperaceae bacterium]